MKNTVPGRMRTAPPRAAARVTGAAAGSSVCVYTEGMLYRIKSNSRRDEEKDAEKTDKNNTSQRVELNRKAPRWSCESRSAQQLTERTRWSEASWSAKLLTNCLDAASFCNKFDSGPLDGSTAFRPRSGELDHCHQ